MGVGVGVGVRMCLCLTVCVYDTLMCVCRYLQRCPVVFLQSSVVATVTQCGLACSTLGHRDAFSSVMKYFRDLLHLPQQEATVRVCDVCVVWCGVVCGVGVCDVWV